MAGVSWHVTVPAYLTNNSANFGSASLLYFQVFCRSDENQRADTRLT